MDARQVVLTLCREAAEADGPEEQVIDGYIGNHAGCCWPDDVEAAALGDVAATLRIRRCAGLPVTS